MKLPGCDVGYAEETAYRIRSPKIPTSFDGFKIAHISDLHSRPARGAGEIIKEQKPNITVITGDLLHDDGKDVDGTARLIEEILEVSPIYAVTGNHDLWRCGHEKIFRDFERLGVKFLRNEYVEIERNGEKFVIFGAEDPFSKVPQIISENVKKSLALANRSDGYKILLFHRANLFDEIKDYGFDLILAGHMHGGQFAVPHIGGAVAPSSSLLSGKRMFFPDYCRGVAEYGETTMIINRGLGNTLPVPRWGNRPETGIITLLKS